MNPTFPSDIVDEGGWGAAAVARKPGPSPAAAAPLGAIQGAAPGHAAHPGGPLASSKAGTSTQAPAFFSPASVDSAANLLGAGMSFVSGVGGSDPAASALNSHLARMALTGGSSLVQRSVSGWFNWFSLHSLKHYFHVNNSYVIKKFRIVLCPLLHRDWVRKPCSARGPADQPAAAGTAPDAGVEYEPPATDVNAPDLYIPLMAFVTYLLLRGYSIGLADAFHPELLANLASSTFLALLFELALVKLALLLIGSPATPPRLLELCAYSGYKYLGYIVALLGGLLLGRGPFYLLLLVLAAMHGIFLVRTLDTGIRVGEAALRGAGPGGALDKTPGTPGAPGGPGAFPDADAALGDEGGGYSLAALGFGSSTASASSAFSGMRQMGAVPGAGVGAGDASAAAGSPQSSSLLAASRRRTFLLLVGLLQVLLALLLLHGALPNTAVASAASTSAASSSSLLVSAWGWLRGGSGSAGAAPAAVGKSARGGPPVVSTPVRAEEEEEEDVEEEPVARKTATASSTPESELVAERAGAEAPSGAPKRRRGKGGKRTKTAGARSGAGDKPPLRRAPAVPPEEVEHAEE